MKSFKDECRDQETEKYSSYLIVNRRNRPDSNVEDTLVAFHPFDPGKMNLKTRYSSNNTFVKA